MANFATQKIDLSMDRPTLRAIENLTKATERQAKALEHQNQITLDIARAAMGANGSSMDEIDQIRSRSDSPYG